MYCMFSDLVLPSAVQYAGEAGVLRFDVTVREGEGSVSYSAGRNDILLNNSSPLKANFCL